MPKPPSLLLIYTIILLEGFVTVSVQILTIRQLIPFVGNSVTVTSLIIGIFLLCLAKGYLQGGRVSKDHTETLVRNFLFAGIILVLGFSYPFLYNFFGFFSYTLKIHLLWCLTIYLLLVIAPLVYLLGQTVPITMHLYRDNGSVSKVGADVLHLSTIGSFLGAVLTSLLCMRFLGVANTIMLNFVILWFLITMLVFHSNKQWPQFMTATLCIAMGIYLHLHFEKNFFIATTEFANYQVYDHTYKGREGRLLSINHSASSFIDKEQRGFEYAERLKHILQERGTKGQQILVLGAGGFVMGADDPDNTYTYVDIDPQLPIIAKKHFINDINGKVVIEDARKYLLETDTQYDIIINDAFSNRKTVPMHLTTQAYHELVKAHLKPGGIAMYNWIINPWLNDNFSQGIDNTLRAVFNTCITSAISHRQDTNNVLYMCYEQPNRSQTIYTDNDNRNAFDALKVH